MKLLKKGDKSRKQTIVDIETNVVVCHHASQHPSLGDDERLQLEWAFDFANVDQADILEAAAETFLIKNRRKFVNVKKPTDTDWDGATFDVSKLLTVRTSPIDKARQSLLNLSDGELLAMGIDPKVFRK